MKRVLSILLFSILLLHGYADDNIRILIFSKTSGFRHQCIPTGIAAINKLATENHWTVYSTEDSTYFTRKNLDQYDLVIFMSTTGNVFDPKQKEAFRNYIESGHSLLTIHSGTNTEEEWPWYVNAVGGIFVGHPPTQKATVVIEDRNHPATKHFTSDKWEAIDEWYSFDRNPRDSVHVLISIDESSYSVDDNRWFNGVKQRMGDHPIVWYKSVGNGIVFQTAFGHTDEMYTDPLFLNHLKGAIEWLSPSNK